MKYSNFFILFFVLITSSASALDGEEDGSWISLGSPTNFHIGTKGSLYINGSNQGSCGSVRPNYFRVNMDAEHFNAFYSYILYAAAQNISLDCRVVTGCGSEQVWVEYCRGKL